MLPRLLKYSFPEQKNFQELSIAPFNPTHVFFNAKLCSTHLYSRPKMCKIFIFHRFFGGQAQTFNSKIPTTFVLFFIPPTLNGCGNPDRMCRYTIFFFCEMNVKKQMLLCFSVSVYIYKLYMCIHGPWYLKSKN